MPRDENLWYERGLGRSPVLEHADDDHLNMMDKVRGRTRISGVLDDEGLAGFMLYCRCEIRCRFSNGASR